MARPWTWEGTLSTGMLEGTARKGEDHVSFGGATFEVSSSRENTKSVKLGLTDLLRLSSLSAISLPSLGKTGSFDGLVELLLDSLWIQRESRFESARLLLFALSRWLILSSASPPSFHSQSQELRGRRSRSRNCSSHERPEGGR